MARYIFQVDGFTNMLALQPYIAFALELHSNEPKCLLAYHLENNITWNTYVEQLCTLLFYMKYS
jgi:hypothetical protein